MKRHVHTALCVFGWLVLPAFAHQVSAQQTETNIQFKLAQSYEQQGEWERALPLYEALHRTEPQNYVFFDALRRTYSYLKMYDNAIRLVEDRRRLFPDDPLLKAILGSLVYQSGDETRANVLWQELIQSDAKNLNVYRLVASQMTEHRLYDQAINLYLQARTATGDQRAFAEELAWLYSSFQQFASATKEFVRILRASPAQLNYVQSRLSVFTAREDGMQQAIDVVRTHAAQEQTHIPLRTLLAWLYMERKDFPAALAEYRVIDRLNKANGQELFNFAQRALQERAYSAAATAYREVLEQHPNRERQPMAQFGFARAVEELSYSQDTTVHSAAPPAPGILAPEGISETRPTFRGALALYEKIVQDYPGTEFAAQAHYRIGMIRRETYFDLGRALASFGNVRETTRATATLVEATIQIAEIHTMQNDLNAARMEYARLLVSPSADVRDRATFRLAELDYFEGKFDSALTRMQPLTTNVATDLANDALQLQYFIQENKSSVPLAVAAFAKADLLMRQRKHSEALAQFQSLAHQYPYSLLYDDAVMKTGELHLRLNQVTEALAAFTSVAEEIPNSIFRDRAQFRIGETYELVVKDRAKAVEAYERILAKHPHSLHAEEARRRVRMLRGDLL
jgi:tetratricopeptide (TPR) repeat protein